MGAPPGAGGSLGDGFDYRGDVFESAKDRGNEYGAEL